MEYSLHGGFSPKVSVGVGNIAESKKPLIVHMCAFLQTPNDIKNLQLLFNSKQNQTITIETVSNTDTEMNNHSQFLVCKCEKCRHFLIEMAQKGVNLFSCTFVCSTLTLTKKMNKKGSQEVTSENSTNAELVKDSTYDK